MKVTPVGPPIDATLENVDSPALSREELLKKDVVQAVDGDDQAVLFTTSGQQLKTGALGRLKRVMLTTFLPLFVAVFVLGIVQLTIGVWGSSMDETLWGTIFVVLGVLGVSVCVFIGCCLNRVAHFKATCSPSTFNCSQAQAPVDASQMQAVIVERNTVEERTDSILRILKTGGKYEVQTGVKPHAVISALAEVVGAYYKLPVKTYSVQTSTSLVGEGGQIQWQFGNVRYSDLPNEPIEMV